jgi:uncharacterized metal-binding protein YceD (DUF177 family)
MDNFIIKLGIINNGENYFSFKIKDQFFESCIFQDIKHVDISAYVILDKDNENISLNLKIEGKINNLACDICAEKLSIQISGETNMIVKKNDDNLISTDEIFYVQKSENSLNLKQLIYELIIVSVPKKREHPTDNEGNRTCDKEMIALVKKYTQSQKKASDPRWGVLKNLK